MAILNTLINIQIAEVSSSVATASTTIPLILGTSPAPSSWASGDLVHSYFAIADVLADGWNQTSPEYQAAQLLCSQTIVPSEFLIGIRKDTAEPAQAQINTITVDTVADATTYALTINGTAYTITSSTGSTERTINQQLAAAIQADSAAAVTTDVQDNNHLVLTAKLAGVALVYSNVTSNLDNGLSYAAKPAQNGDIDANDIASIQAINDSWYGLVLAGASDNDIKAAAAYIESQEKMLFAATAATDFALANALKASSYTRTATAISPTYANGIMAAYVGGLLPQVAGSVNWAWKTVKGIAADALSPTQLSTILGNRVAGVPGNNANVCTNVANTPTMLLGTVASGDYIDIILGKDALTFRLRSNLLNLLNTNGKIPMTDAGVAMVEGVVRTSLLQSVNDGFVNADFTVTAIKVADWPVLKRQQRICPTVTFTATLTGAIDAVPITGSISA